MNEKELSHFAKDYFQQIRKTDRLIRRLVNTARELRSGMESIGSAIKPDKVQSSPGGSAIEDVMCKIDELERKISARIDELVSLKQEAFDRIGRISDFDQQNVLIGRYIQMGQWEDIADDLGFSVQWVYEIHGNALLSFIRANTELLENREKQSSVA